MKLGFDVISDLYLTDNSFDWDGKVTSLFCLVCGNISNDLSIVDDVLTKLSKVYNKVFFIEGSLEHKDLFNHMGTITTIEQICSNLENVIYLYDNVAILNGIAIVGCNGWYGNVVVNEDEDSLLNLSMLNFQDLVYLTNTIKKLQLYNDVEQIIVVTSSIPSKGVCLEDNGDLSDLAPYPAFSLTFDTEHKVSTWVFGSYDKMINAIGDDGVKYVNNGCFNANPYWAKRIELD
jgi:hypothetical protein